MLKEPESHLALFVYRKEGNRFAVVVRETLRQARHP